MSRNEVCFSTLIAGCGAAIFLFVAVLADATSASAETAAPRSGEKAMGLAARDFQLPSEQLAYPFHGPRGDMKAGDELALLQAIDIALTQAGDGATYVWKRDHGRLTGSIRMTCTFRDGTGRICRHLEMKLTAGALRRGTEGIACRAADGAWVLEG